MQLKYEEYMQEEEDQKKSRRKNFIICLLFTMFMLPFPVGCIVIGFMYHNQCHLESGWIPIYLIVLGLNCTFILEKFLLKDVLKLKIYCCLSQMYLEIASKLFHCFYYIWIALGCYLIYSNFEPEYKDETSPLYCHSILYGTSFFVTALLLGFLVFYHVQNLCFQHKDKEFPPENV